MKSSSELSVTIGGTTYAARQMPNAGTRNLAETASLVTREVHPPGTDNVCNGYVDGTLTASLVEIMNIGSSSEIVGPGRLSVAVELGR